MTSDLPKTPLPGTSSRVLEIFYFLPGRAVIFTAFSGFLLLSACGGGDTSPKMSSKTPGLFSNINQNSVLISDMLFTVGGTQERISNVTCTADGAVCQVTYEGQTFTVYPDGSDDSDNVDAEIYRTLGEWNYMASGVIYGHFQDQGIQTRLAGAGGVVHRGSVPHGSATWTGDMVAFDSNNRVVRGGASITLTDLGNPYVDVRLTPQSYPAMEWSGLPVTNGGFSDRQASSDYIKGEFYGPNAKEAGGVFERNALIGAFGATQ